MSIPRAQIHEQLQPSPAAVMATQALLSNGSARSPMATRLRDSIVFDESVIFECVNEAIGELDAHRAEVMRRALSTDQAFGLAIKRLTVDVGVVLSLAKTFEDDSDFLDSAALLNEIDFQAFDGRIADFALLLVETDMRNLKDAKDGRPSADAAIYELLQYDVIKRRLQTLHAFVSIARKSGRQGGGTTAH